METNPQVLELLNQNESDLDWVKNNLNYLQDKYNEEFIAIKEGKVIDHAKLITDLIKKVKKQEINITDTLVYFVSKIAIVL